jgi:hypothetical protein
MIALLFRLMRATLNIVNIVGVSVKLHYLFKLLSKDLFGAIVSDGHHMQYYAYYAKSNFNHDPCLQMTRGHTKGLGLILCFRFSFVFLLLINDAVKSI